MAAPMDIVTVIEDKAREFLEREDIRVKKLSVVRKSGRFTNGDIVIPSGCLGKLEAKVLSKLREMLLKELKLSGHPVAKVDGDDFNSVAVYLDRCSVFMETVSTVLKESKQYGTNKNKRDETILICNENLLKNSTNESKENISLESLRALVIQNHMVNLLQSQSYNVCQPVQRGALQTYENLFLTFGMDSSSCKEVSLDTEKKMPVIMKFINSSYVKISQLKDVAEIVKSKAEDVENEPEGMERKTDLENDYEFDMKKYIEETGYHKEVNGLDKNLSVCTVFSSSAPSAVLSEAVVIHSCLQEVKAQSCIHITGERRAFSQQKVHLILRELQMGNTQLSQSHFVCGRVCQTGKGTDTSTVNVDDLFSLRYAQLRQAAIMKYGENVHGEGWAATLEALTAACIKFEMLSCVHRNSLKLNVCEEDMEGSGAGTSAGSFVMYNCARLATLFKHFEEEVESGTYPPLPPVEEVDFSTLREEAEWSLLFNYVYPFPHLVEQTVENVSDNTSVFVNIHTHKICQMLISLSRCLSSYYSRYHVLGEPRAQLLPTMYARLYLLKAVHQVMINGLALMGIQPLSQL